MVEHEETHAEEKVYLSPNIRAPPEQFILPMHGQRITQEGPLIPCNYGNNPPPLIHNESLDSTDLHGGIYPPILPFNSPPAPDPAPQNISPRIPEPCPMQPPLYSLHLPHALPNWNKRVELMYKYHNYRSTLYLPRELISLISNLIYIEDRDDQSYNFDNLLDFLTTIYLDEKTLILNKIIPGMCGMLIQIENIFPNTTTIPYSTPNLWDNPIYINKKQVACLQMCSFFCLFSPKSNPHLPKDLLNFGSLYSLQTDESNRKSTQELLKFYLLGYFHSILQYLPSTEDFMTFTRVGAKPAELMNGLKSKKLEQSVQQFVKGKIDIICCEGGVGVVQDKMKEGGTLVSYGGKWKISHEGSSADKSLFYTHTELLVSRLLAADLRTNEALLVTSINQINNYSGITQNPKFAGLKHPYHTLRGLVILPLPTSFTQNFFQLELFKVLYIFYNATIQKMLEGSGEGKTLITKSSSYSAPDVKEDFLRELKFLIGWMAATQYSRSFTFIVDDMHGVEANRFANECLKFGHWVAEHQLTVGVMYQIVLEFFIQYTPQSSTEQLFPYIMGYPAKIRPKVDGAKETTVMDRLNEQVTRNEEVVNDKRTDITGLLYEESKEDYGLSSSYVEKPRMDKEKLRDHDSRKLETHDSSHSGGPHDIHGRPSSLDKHRRHGSHDRHASHETKHHTTGGTSNTLKLPHQEHYWEKVVKHLKALSKGPKIYDIIKDMKEINYIVNNNSFSLFSLLNKYYDNLSAQAKNTFQKVIIPRLAQYALDLPTTFRGTDHEKGLKILELETTGYVIFDKVHVATLQACLFFGLFNPHHSKGLHKDLNYTALFNDIYLDDICLSKIKCLITGYFYSLTRHKSMDKREFMTIKRVSKALPNLGNSYTTFWSQSETQLINVQIHSSGTIETRVKGSELVCFANKHFGRHVMEGKTAAEDLLFLSIPELYLCRLVCPALSENEAIQISGVRKILEISKTMGQITFTEAHGKPLTCVTGIDADNYSQDKNQQFSEPKILRELWKAVIGFDKDPMNLERNKHWICTGNWGCGINLGDLQLKFLIQWMAASQAGRAGVHYYTFGAKELVKADIIIGKLGRCSVGQIFQLLNYYGGNVHRKEHMTLFDFCLDQ